MKFHEFGNRENPHIMMIHGGGKAWWNYLRQARALSEDYHVILPTLDGHGEEHHTEYVSTTDSAQKLISYIDENCGGHLFMLCGVSLGGQIVIEMLSLRGDISQKAMIDGSICYPQPKTERFCTAVVRLLGGVMFSRVSCRCQMLFLRLFPKMRFPKELEDYYIQDIPLLRKTTLYNMYRTYMAEYQLKEDISKTNAQILYCYGSREMKCVKRSAQLLKEKVPSCRIYEAKGYNHGELAIYRPNEWLKFVEPFLNT